MPIKYIANELRKNPIHYYILQDVIYSYLYNLQ